MIKNAYRATFLLFLILFSFQGISNSEELLVPSLLDFIGRTPEAEEVKKSAPVDKQTIINAIEIKGQSKVPKEKILDAIFSKVGEAVIEAKVNADVKSIYALGFFADVSADTQSYSGGKKIVYKVVENPLIAKISFEGNSVFSYNDLISSMETEENKILNFVKLRNDINNIDTLYHGSGYILARVVDVLTDPDTGVLSIKLIEGKIEGVTVEGNNNTQDYVILRELNTKAGSVLNDKVLTKDLRRIFNLGFFSEVSPAFRPGDSSDSVILVVRVAEQRTSTINLGGGYGEREGWFGFVDLNVNNLFGTGQAVMIRAQSGQELQTYQFKYFNPWILEEQTGDHTSFTFKKWYTIGSDFYYSGYNEVHNGVSVALGKPFSEDWRASISLGSEWVGPYGDSSFEAYDAFTTGLSLSYDTRDFWMNPTQGVFHTASTKWGWTYASETTQYMKYGLDLNFFIPLAERQTLALHNSASIGMGDVPVGERYWVGGANSVRGFDPSESHIGTRKLLANIEYRYTFNEVFQGVIFTDYGNAWYSGPPDFEDFITGTGLGIRLNTPLGPLRLDYGVGAGKGKKDTGGIIHFSIGQAF